MEIFNKRRNNIESERSSSRRIVWKLGTSTLCRSDGSVRDDLLQSFAVQTESLQQHHIDSVFVSSGAVAVGKLRSPEVHDRTLLAAIGQPLLTHAWNKAFYPHVVAQFLFTDAELQDSVLLKKRIRSALQHRIIPVINCVNPDTNNDYVSAQIARAIEAEKLALLTTTHGVLRNGKSVHSVSNKAEIVDVLTNTVSIGGTGGMGEKCDAALSFLQMGGNAVIAHGHDQDILRQIAHGHPFQGTRFQ